MNGNEEEEEKGTSHFPALLKAAEQPHRTFSLAGAIGQTVKEKRTDTDFPPRFSPVPPR